MADTHANSSSTDRRTVQDYIDERPVWPDGTQLPTAPMTTMQWSIWTLAAAGKFFEGFVVFMTGVTLPLIARHFGISSTENGLVSAATLFGILVGAVSLGGLSDRFGRKRMFIVEMFIFMVFLVLLVFANQFAWLVICLFGIGLALGCDYPTAHMIISENIPTHGRGRLVLAAFGFQALGALGGTAVGYLVLSLHPQIDAWRWMYATAIVPGVIVTLSRFYLVESANWLHARGDTAEAEQAARRLLSRTPQYPQDIRLSDHANVSTGRAGQNRSFMALFSAKYRRATILASVPWFIQDLGTYGIGIFTPTILAASFGHKTEHIRSTADVVQNALLASKGAALTNTLLIVGIVFAVQLSDRVGRIPLQILGFFGCAAGLFLAAMSSYVNGSSQTMLIFAGFFVFNFMTNIGPNAQTYLLAGEVFPTEIRGKGAGFAASFAKIGAVATAFLFPILLAGIGTSALLYILVGTSILGAAVTWATRINTTGVSLDRIGQ